MSIFFEELAYTPTPIGNLSLRRRRIPQIKDTDVYEIKLNDYFLMSSLFHEAEDQLAFLGLQAVETSSPELDVVVGGLGLGYTAVAALKDKRVKSLIVVEYLEAVMDWHRQRLVPLGSILTEDPRCKLLHADFFERARHPIPGFGDDETPKLFDAVLLDIDHAPDNVLHQTNKRFYTRNGLLELQLQLKPGGVFALWADQLPNESFTQHLNQVFAKTQAHTISFENPITEGVSHGTVYVAVHHPHS